MWKKTAFAWYNILVLLKGNLGAYRGEQTMNRRRRIFQYCRGNAMGGFFVVLLIALFVCIYPCMAYAAGDGNSGDKNTSADTSKKTGFTVTIEAVRLSSSSGTVIVSSKGSKAEYYYVLVKEYGETAPSAAEIKKNGVKSWDGLISIPPLSANVEYVFYAVAEDENGRFSNVVSQKAVSSDSKGIEIEGHIYFTLQPRDEIDDYLNEPGEISINLGTAKDVKSIEYIIADKFASSAGMIESIATEEQDVTTSAGASSVTLSKWTRYNVDEKPGLVRNMLNYIYVRITDGDGNTTYISSRGIWEDENAPVAMSVTAEAEETTAVVTVTGDDDESGVKKYYFLLHDPIDLSVVEPEDVRTKGMKSDDGIFELSGLNKRTRYDLYAVVEDMAGNLSEIRNGTMTTAGEAEASAVRPSSDTSSNPGSTSNVTKRTDGVTLEDPEVIETVPERTPYLVSSEKKEFSDLIKIAGWDNIKTVVAKSAEPADIYIDMNGGGVVPGDVLADVAGRRITYHFIMDDVFTWVIKGRDLQTAPMSTDLRVSRGYSNIPAKLINELAGVYPREEFTIEHDGAFGFKTVLDIDLGTANQGKNAHLYYYNEKDYRLETLQTVVVDERGKASFTISDESDLVVIVGPVTETEKPADVPEEQESTDDNAADTIINTRKSSGTVWIIVVSVIAVLLFVFILIFPRERSKEDDTNEGDKPEK